jgi:hypothetical protein
VIRSKNIMRMIPIAAAALFAAALAAFMLGGLLAATSHGIYYHTGPVASGSQGVFYHC